LGGGRSVGLALGAACVDLLLKTDAGRTGAKHVRCISKAQAYELSFPVHSEELWIVYADDHRTK
jgi:hypothetical protein